MSFFNLGKKDADGRQVRIEHRGRYLRASRTGGLALRAQTKAAGVNFTGNTAHGIRVSATPVKDTEIALQNGRFILRGRYGRGPTKLNLSKTGLTVSTRNQLGTFNWIKPNRSSAKVAGVQVRGRNAVILQSIYFGFAAIGMVLRAAVTGLRILMQLLAWLAGFIQWAIRQTPPALKSVKRTIRNKWLRRRQKRLDPSLFQALGEASNDELKSMVWLTFTQWGRGKSVHQDAPANDSNDPQESRRSSTLLRAVERDSTDGDWHLAFLAGIADEISMRLDSQNRAEILLDIDETLLPREAERFSRNACWRYTPISPGCGSRSMHPATPSPKDRPGQKGQPHQSTQLRSISTPRRSTNSRIYRTSVRNEPRISSGCGPFRALKTFDRSTALDRRDYVRSTSTASLSNLVISPRPTRTSTAAPRKMGTLDGYRSRFPRPSRAD